MVDDTSKAWWDLPVEQYEEFRANVQPRYKKPTKKSAARLAQKLAVKYQIPFFYYSNRAKKLKNSGLKRCKIVFPIVDKK